MEPTEEHYEQANAESQEGRMKPSVYAKITYQISKYDSLLSEDYAANNERYNQKRRRILLLRKHDRILISGIRLWHDRSDYTGYWEDIVYIEAMTEDGGCLGYIGDEYGQEIAKTLSDGDNRQFYLVATIEECKSAIDVHGNEAPEVTIALYHSDLKHRRNASNIHKEANYSGLMLADSRGRFYISSDNGDQVACHYENVIDDRNNKWQDWPKQNILPYIKIFKEAKILRLAELHEAMERYSIDATDDPFSDYDRWARVANEERAIEQREIIRNHADLRNRLLRKQSEMKAQIDLSEFKLTEFEAHTQCDQEEVFNAAQRINENREKSNTMLGKSLGILRSFTGEETCNSLSHELGIIERYQSYRGELIDYLKNQGQRYRRWEQRHRRDRAHYEYALLQYLTFRKLSPWDYSRFAWLDSSRYGHNVFPKIQKYKLNINARKDENELVKHMHDRYGTAYGKYYLVVLKYETEAFAKEVDKALEELHT